MRHLEHTDIYKIQSLRRHRHTDDNRHTHNTKHKQSIETLMCTQTLKIHAHSVQTQPAHTHRDTEKRHTCQNADTDDTTTKKSGEGCCQQFSKQNLPSNWIRFHESLEFTHKKKHRRE